MVKESQLTRFSESSKFVQQYALGNGLLSSHIPETDVVFTSSMIVVLDVLVRKNSQSFTPEELAAGTGLDEDTIQSVLEDFLEKGFVEEVGGEYTLNNSDELMQIVKEEHPAIGI